MIYKVHVCGVPKDTNVAVKVFYQIDSDSKRTIRKQMQLQYDSIWSMRIKVDWVRTILSILNHSIIRRNESTEESQDTSKS
jgi:hypothetical protein